MTQMSNPEVRKGVVTARVKWYQAVALLKGMNVREMGKHEMALEVDGGRWRSLIVAVTWAPEADNVPQLLGARSTCRHLLTVQQP